MRTPITYLYYILLHSLYAILFLLGFLPDFTGKNQPLVTEENVRYNEEKKILNVLLSTKMKADEKIKILEEDFQIPMEGERGKVFI